MPWYCKTDKDTELLEVYIKGFPSKGANVLTPTIFQYCPKCQQFYRLVPEEMPVVEKLEEEAP